MLATTEMGVKAYAVYGLKKSSANPMGNKVILGRGMSLELLLILIVDVIAKDIVQYELKD